MKKALLIVYLIALVFFSNAQTAPQKFWVQFTDKSNSSYSISSPQAFLSDKALERRSKSDIAVTEQDIPVNQAYIDQVLAIGDLFLLHESKWFNSISIFCSDSALMLEVSALPFVQTTRNVNRFETEPIEVNSTRAASSTSENIDYGASFTQIEQINGLPLHQRGFKGEGIYIGVLDAGFRFYSILPIFEKARNEGRINQVIDFAEGDFDVDGHSNHGTYVLSTMAGYDEGNLIGTAPDANYFLFRTEESDSEFVIEEDNWVAAVEMADKLGIDVINSSLGYSLFDNPAQDHSYAEMNGETARISIAAQIAANKGMLVVTSAGNSGSSPWKYITAPGDAKDILTIGAVTTDGVHAAFSGFGPTADGRIKPNVMAMGQAATFASLDSTFIQGNGTSFSSPILCGMAACLWQAHPNKNNMEIISAIERSAQLYSAPNDSMGYGIPDFWKAHLLLREPDAVEPPEVLIYPNPNQGTFRFEFLNAENSSEQADVRIIDALGKEIFKSCVGRSENHFFGEVTLADLADGIYLLELLFNEQRVVQRFQIVSQ
jgi:serine protease AprX